MAWVQVVHGERLHLLPHIVNLRHGFIGWWWHSIKVVCGAQTTVERESVAGHWELWGKEVKESVWCWSEERERLWVAFIVKGGLSRDQIALNAHQTHRIVNQTQWIANGWKRGSSGTLGAPAPRFIPLPPILCSVLVQNHGIRICRFGIFITRIHTWLSI